MKCERCGFESPSGFSFCGKCGAPLLAVCPRCGFENPPGLAFCGKCGKSLAAQECLTTADLEHLRTYLPLDLVQSLQFDLVSPPPRLLEQCTARLSGLLETIRTHLPAFLAERVLSNPSPGKIGGQFIQGTLLFADISGFTAMSERLSRIGREGAEEITTIVNRYFDTMLVILREQGGQLITFGGDALLGLFVEPQSAARAAQTALAMQAAMAGLAQIRTSQGIFPLQMKVGLHRGRFFAAQLGGLQGMEYALFGADVNATAATESAAVASQVLLDRATCEAIGVPCRTVPASNGYFVIEHIEPASSLLPSPSRLQPSSCAVEPTLDGLRLAVERLDALSPYLPAGLLARIVSEPRSASLEGEHRLVSVLFANIHGLGEVADSLGPGREAQIVSVLNRYFIAMGDAIHRFGGVINKMDLYDRGDKLLAFFGAPQAHEDDAERAVRAALAMQETLEKVACTLPNDAGLPDVCLSQHIGISYGYVYAGYVGAAWRREYTVMGDDVNLAARLMSAAPPGDVLVSTSVRRKAQAVFELIPRGEIKLKGKQDPAPVFAVAGVRAMPESLRGLRGMYSPLVGRETEWERLGVAMNQLVNGRGQIVSVLGEAGLGKSRLAAEMRQHIRTVSSPGVAIAQWVEGRCLSYTEAVSFMPFQEVLRQFAGVRQDDSAAEAGAKLRSLLDRRFAPEEALAHLPYLTTFLNLPLDESQQDKVRYLDAEALQRRTFIAISALVEAEAASAPLVVALEDIHWLDPASQRLLEFLMPLVDRSPFMLLLLYRPERSKTCWQIHEKVMREFSHCSVDIALRPLDPGQSRELLTNLVKLDRWPAEMGELILGRTEGNPLFVEEMIRALMDDGVLARDEKGQWQLSGNVDVNRLPDTLQGVMMARLDRLEEPARWTAQVASVEGRIFDFDVLAHVDAEHRGDLPPRLVRLQQHEIVRETQRVPFLMYTFRHAMMHEVCYNSLLARVRRLYHCRIAEYLESTRSDESDYAVIAQHAFLGQDWLRALRYQLLAGEQARRMFANLNAIEHLERAAECVSHLASAETFEQRLKLDLMQGELLTMTGQYDHALEHLNAALAQAVERGDQDAQAHACRWLARLHELRGEYPAAFDWIQQGLEVLQSRETTEAAEMLLIAGLIHTRQGNYENALTQCERGLRIAQTLGQMTVLARAYNLLGHITRLRGNSARAIEHFQKSFELYQGAGDIGGQALAQNQIANAYYDVSQWREADHHYRQAREAFSLLGDVYNQAIASNNLGGIALNQGRLDEALADYQEALRQMEQIGGSLYILGILRNNLGSVFVRRRDVQAARQHLQASQEYFDKAQVRDFMPELRRHQSEAALVAGELVEAEESGQQALSLACELSMRGEQGISLRVLGEIALAQGRLDQAEQRLRESVAILAEVGDEYEGARSKLTLARVHAAQGERAETRSALQQCIPVFERLEAALDLAAARELMIP